MTISIGASLVAYIATVLCSLVVAKRSSNNRLRLLAFTVALLPLCQLVVLLGTHHIWLARSVTETAESLELLLSALCLTAVHLLSKENTDRKSTDLRLRLVEVESGPSSPSKSTSRVKRKNASASEIPAP
jgi:hypothetical protein